MSLILALEFEPERVQILKRLVGQWMDAEVVVASSTDEAIAFMQQHGPDLILVSSLLRPNDDKNLTEFLKQATGIREVPAVTVPPFIDPGAATLQHERHGLLSRMGLVRRRGPWPYDPQALSFRLKEAFEASCAMARLRDVGDAQTEPQAIRDRARRWSGKDLSWLTEVKLPWGLQVDLLNISSSGVLVESAVSFVEGSTTEFRLNGPNQQLIIPATVVRSEVALADSRGVTYRAAAIFEQARFEAELLGPLTDEETAESGIVLVPVAAGSYS